MSELRELLRLSILSGTTDDLLRALVEAVEPEESDVRDATIRKLREERDQATGEREKWRIRHSAVQGLRLDERAQGMQLGTRLADAKDEIVKLRKERDSAELKLETLKPIDARILADAEIGRLVRGMRAGSTLRRCTACLDRPDWVAHWSGARGMIIVNSGSDDPAEALRSIQASE